MQNHLKEKEKKKCVLHTGSHRVLTNDYDYKSSRQEKIKEVVTLAT